MKFSVKTQEFIKGISSVEGIISVREIKSALSNLKIEAENNSISISATDLEISLRTTIPAETKVKGIRSIPAKQLSSVMKSINFPLTQVEADENEEEGKRTLITDASGVKDFKMYINGVDSEEIKTIGNHSKGSAVEFPTFIFNSMLKKVSYAVALEDTRFVFNGLYVITTEDKLVVVGTDGRRLAKIERAIPNKIPFTKGIIIPHKAVKEIVKMLELSENGLTDLVDNQIYISTKDIELQSKLIDGNYPDYEAVIPKVTKNTFRGNKDEFLIAIRQALIAAEEPTKQIRLGLSKNSLNINSNNPGATEFSQNIPIEYEGEDYLIGFKGEYLQDAIRSIDDAEFVIEFSNPNSPIVLKDPSDKDYISVIMPMKL
ncbi:MAG: DNA polymerase III subunit beta [Leptospiraceae bacterium]|nr:DNA polymerase III subunit beta [Leptospiraceae bacterium]